MPNSYQYLVSIIVPVYKTEPYLRDCLDSILNQSFKDYEVICIDDGSPDNSIDILNEYCSLYSNFSFFRQTNQGLAASRNNGIKKAKGKYLFPLDSDDVLDRDCLLHLVNSLKNKECDIATPVIVKFFPDGKIYNFLGAEPTPCNMSQYSNHIVCSSLFPKEFIDKYGGYDEENFKFGAEDYDLWLRFIDYGKKIKRVKKALFYYRQKSFSQSMGQQYLKNNELILKTNRILYQKHWCVRKYTCFHYIFYKQIVRYSKRYFNRYIFRKELVSNEHKYQYVLFSRFIFKEVYF